MIKEAREAKMDRSYSLAVTSPHHQKQAQTTAGTMLIMITALIPSLIWACVRLGLRSLLVSVVCVVSCVLFEFAYQMILRRATTIHDLSAVVTGMLIAFNMPVAVPIYIPIVACFFAMIVVKQVFGGIGKNYLNPALAAIVLTSLIWKKQMDPTFVGSKWCVNLDNIESPSPLSYLKLSDIPSEDFFDLFFGNTTGAIGAISAAMLLIGAVYLLITKVITWHIPVAYLGTATVLFYLMAEDGLEIAFTVSSLCSGALILGAFYMATDYTTSPMTARGKIVYGVGCAVLTVILRTYTGLMEDMAIAVLIMNLLSRPIDALVKPRFFGYVQKKAK